MNESFSPKRDHFNKKGKVSSNPTLLEGKYVIFREGTASLRHRFLKVKNSKKKGVLEPLEDVEESDPRKIVKH